MSGFENIPAITFGQTNGVVCLCDDLFIQLIWAGNYTFAKLPGRILP